MESGTVGEGGEGIMSDQRWQANLLDVTAASSENSESSGDDLVGGCWEQQWQWMRATEVVERCFGGGGEMERGEKKIEEDDQG